MSKRILAIYYTQTGQLEEIITNITVPFLSDDTTVEKVRIKPINDYPFPWNSEHFFAIMPDCVLDVPTQLQPFQLKEKKYDLILLGYQAWFLSPCIPVNSLFEMPIFKEVINGTPIITITGARNMWINAFERLKKKLRDNNANLVGNIALVEKHANLISLVTISYWMFKGIKGKFLGILPKPGVSEMDIRQSSSLGEIIKTHLDSNSWETLQEDIKKAKGVEVIYRLLYIERTAKRLFAIWAGFISKKQQQQFWLKLFKYYLIVAVVIVAPIVLTFDAIFVKPFKTHKIKLLIEKYSGII